MVCKAPTIRPQQMPLSVVASATKYGFLLIRHETKIMDSIELSIMPFPKNV